MKKTPSSGKLNRFYKEDADVKIYFKKYACHLSELLKKVDCDILKEVVDCFLKARQRSSTIFFAGNGGSAATASHFAQDLAEAGRKSRGPIFKTISLTDNISGITALANDYGYNTIFEKQMEGLFKKGDVLVAISASGNSSNIIRAAEYAEKTGGIVVGLVGFDGGRLAKICTHALNIKTERGEYGPVEDLHLVLDHMITSYIMMKDFYSRK